MKCLNIAFIAVLVFTMISCGGNAKKTAHIEESESMEIGDNDIDDVVEDDETEYLEAAMKALDAGDSDKAVENIMQAAEVIKGYVGEMDDPVDASTAIESLLDLATKIKSGMAMTSDELEESLLKLEFFSEDDLEIDDDEVEDSES